MSNNRRDFLKLAGMAGIGLISAGNVTALAFGKGNKRNLNKVILENTATTLENGSILNTPFWRVESGRDGPSLLLIAAQHGNEVQGTEVARRFKEVCVRQLLNGSVWLVPMANLPAVHIRRNSVDNGPEQKTSKGHNMNLIWPGDITGNDTERLTYSLDQAVLRHCSHSLDMHCWAHFRAAETLAVNDHEPSIPLGEVTTTRFVNYRGAPYTFNPKSEKMLVSQLMRKRGAGAITMELSGQYQMQERQVMIGLSSIINIAKLLGMIEGEPKLIPAPRVKRDSNNSHEILAPCSGIFMPALRKDKTATLIPDDYIKEGQILGHIVRESNLETVKIVAPVSGYLYQFGTCHSGLCDVSLPAQHPYTEEGEIVALIVSV